MSRIIFAGTVPGSPARKLMVDMIADLAQNNDDWSRMVQVLPREALNEAMTTIMGVRRAPVTKPWKFSPSRYSEKEEGTESTVKLRTST